MVIYNQYLTELRSMSWVVETLKKGPATATVRSDFKRAAQVPVPESFASEIDDIHQRHVDFRHLGW